LKQLLITNRKKDNIKNKRTKSWDLKDEQYFVMGENTNHSTDSRFFGPIERGGIVGIYIKTL
jgi:type IV secretory pathway protease TraF